jgi:hypothetical protein
MRKKTLRNLIVCAALASAPAIIPFAASAQAPASPPPAPLMPPSLVPSATVNLMTAEGSAAFGAVWRTAEARTVEVEPMAGRMPGYDKTFDMQPHAGEANFDDSKWQVIEPKGLADRRGGGNSSFFWYRTTLTIPAKVGDFDTTGAKAVFTAYVDDYAEVWINGQMPRRSGYPSPAIIQGLNMPNRVVLAETVKPGDKFQIAVFGINGPLRLCVGRYVRELLHWSGGSQAQSRSQSGNYNEFIAQLQPCASLRQGGRLLANSCLRLHAAGTEAIEA